MDVSAPVAARITEVKVRAGDRVAADESLAILEVMKMEHPVVAPTAGVVKVSVGDSVDAGDLLMSLDAIERQAELERRVEEMARKGRGVNVASAFEIDDVIDPADTRRWITTLLAG